MTRFYGKVGYGVSVEQAPGIWVDEIVERPYFGDVFRNARNLREGENLPFDLNVQNSISILADAYANDHFFAIRYVEWAGALWTVSSVEVQSPRLLLRLGEVYNGPTPAVAATS
jgi:hypothetical protein